METLVLGERQLSVPEEYLILSHGGEFLKPPQSAHSAAARVTCKESASMSVSRRFLKTARYACQSGDSQESRYREEAGQKSERFFRKQKLYLVSEECCSMRRLLKPSESHVRATLSTYKKSSEENRGWVRRNAVRSDDHLNGVKATCGQHQPPTSCRPKRTDDGPTARR